MTSFSNIVGSGGGVDDGLPDALAEGLLYLLSLPAAKDSGLTRRTFYQRSRSPS